MQQENILFHKITLRLFTNATLIFNVQIKFYWILKYNFIILLNSNFNGVRFLKCWLMNWRLARIWRIYTSVVTDYFTVIRQRFLEWVRMTYIYVDGRPQKNAVTGKGLNLQNLQNTSAFDSRISYMDGQMRSF